MKLRLTFKDANALYHLEDELKVALRNRVPAEDEELIEYRASEIMEKLTAKFRFGEYVDLFYDTELDTLTLT